jgi:hypothetical protein
VDHPHLVGVVERDRDVGGDPGRLGRPETVAGGQDLLEVAALDVLHGDVEQPAVTILADVVDGDDAGVVEPTGRLGLAQEAFAELVGDVVVDVEPQGLERHLAADDRVATEVDDSHGAPPEGRLDLVPADVGDRHAPCILLG